jgi:GT2 family glycosyltransferase
MASESPIHSAGATVPRGTAADTSLRVSAIMPVRDGGDMFGASIARLAGCDPAPDELIVVVDGRSDGAAALAASLGARVIELPASLGPARARNAGAAAAAGDVLLFVDADVAVPPDLVGRVAAYLRDHPDVAGVIGSYDAAPADLGFLSQYRNLLHHYVHQTGHEDASTFWCGCGAIRREVFLAVGGLSGRFSDPSVEDIELGYRLRRGGHRVRLAKDLQVTHLKRWTPLSLLRTDIFARAVPWTRLIIRSGVLPNDLNVRTSSRASVALVFVMTGAAAAVPWSAWAAVLAGLAGAALLALNAGFYRFLCRARGPLFMLAAVPWHWLYYACAGIGFVIGAALEALGRSAPAPALPAEPAPDKPRVR